MDAIGVLDSVGIHLRQWRAGQHYMPCPRCSTKKTDRHLSVLVTGEGHAKWKCWRCGDFSGCTEVEARRIEWQERQRQREGRTAPRPAPAPRQPPVAPVTPLAGAEPEHAPFQAKHQEFWDGLEPITSTTPVGRYLAGRGCPMPAAGADLRWHPDFGHLHQREWRGPVMIGLITHALTAEPQSFHFTWLAKDGSGKAPLDRPRLMAKGMSKREGVIRLCDDADLNAWLMVGEGIESTLAAQQCIGLPQAWAAIDAGNLAVMPIPPWLLELVILVDHDKVNPRNGVRAGEAAAKMLEARCNEAGTVDRIWQVEHEREGWDFNDAANEIAANERGVAA